MLAPQQLRQDGTARTLWAELLSCKLAVQLSVRQAGNTDLCRLALQQHSIYSSTICTFLLFNAGDVMIGTGVQAQAAHLLNQGKRSKSHIHLCLPQYSSALNYSVQASICSE